MVKLVKNPSHTLLSELCFSSLKGDFILDRWRSKCGCRGGETWPIALGTTESTFLTMSGSSLWNLACTSGTYATGKWEEAWSTHMLSGSCTLAWANSSEVRDATLGGSGIPTEDGEGPGGDASYRKIQHAEKHWFNVNCYLKNVLVVF